MKSVALVSLLALEDGTPLVDAEVGVRSGLNLFSDASRKDEGANGLVELVDAVVGEGRGLE